MIPLDLVTKIGRKKFGGFKVFKEYFNGKFRFISDFIISILERAYAE